MSIRGAWTCGLTLLAATMMASPKAIAQQQQKPNILVPLWQQTSKQASRPDLIGQRWTIRPAAQV